MPDKARVCWCGTAELLFRRLVRDSENHVDFLGNGEIVAIEQVRVGRHRHHRGTMAQAPGNRHRIGAAGDRRAGVAMSQTLQCDLGQSARGRVTAPIPGRFYRDPEPRLRRRRTRMRPPAAAQFRALSEVRAAPCGAASGPRSRRLELISSGGRFLSLGSGSRTRWAVFSIERSTQSLRPRGRNRSSVDLQIRRGASGGE